MRLVTYLSLLTVPALAACASSANPAPVTRTTAPMVAPEDRELTADQQVAQVLSRLTFGARPGDAQRVREMGVDAWIAMQLTPRRIDDRAADQFLSRMPTLGMTAGQLMAEYQRPQQLRAAIARDSGKATAADSAELRRAQMGYQQLTTEIQTARVARAVLSERQLEEVMVDFWLNHFSVFANKGQVRYYLSDYERAIRAHALGNFRDLLGAVAMSPAMLIYLDNVQSSVEPNRPTLAQLNAPGRVRGGLLGAGGRMRPAPILPQARGRGLNENYARELMELHTLGVDGGYTQNDVINVARALTGWAVDGPRMGAAFVFRAAAHDAGQKVVLGVPLAPGRGIEDGEQVLSILAAHPSTARFIATKLARRFVADTPSTVLVERAAMAFTATRGDIREVVRVIVTSPEFFSMEAYRSKVTSPFELVASTLRALNALPDPTPRTSRIVANLGQPIYGKETPNGYPDVADAWLNTGAILNRINFGTQVVSGQVPGVMLDRWPTAQAVRGAPREQQVDAVIASLLGGSVSPDTRAILLTGKNPFLDANAAADTMAVIDDDPPDMMTGNVRRPLAGARLGGGRGGMALRAQQPDAFAQIVGLALGSPEFQRR